MHKRNLILSCLHNYNYPVIQPFLKSLRATGFNDDLVIFTSGTVSNITKKLLKKQGAIIIEFETTFPFIEGYADVFNHIVPSISLNNYRFLFYLKYLENNAGKYENVMLTDIRDVVFQKNIFDNIVNNHIYYFLEDASEVFRSSQMNYKWCLYANGEAVTNKIIDENVSCAGITLGAYSLMVDYLKYIKSRLDFREDLRWGLDQGIHNEYVYNVPNDDAMIIPNTFPLVLTLGACKSFKRNADGMLINDLKEVYSVIHQYDRFGDLIVDFKKKYVGSRPVQLIKNALFKILP